MMHKGFLHHILFLDIETVPQSPCFEQLPASVQSLFDQKTKYKRKEEVSAADFYDQAGIWAEFGRIICISVAYFVKNQIEKGPVIRSFFNDDEKELLLEFKSLLQAEFKTSAHLLCAHNGKEFDFPYLARRMLIHRIKLPEILNLMGKKPWQVRHLDTMELWKFGDYKHYTSLELMTSVLGLPSPKNEINGNQVRDVFYKQNDLRKIVRYCESDTLALIRVFLYLIGLSEEAGFIVQNNNLN
jgi:DNA polymerase elongation subunit (family B)